MFSSPLARVALIVGLGVGALGLALAVGASAAYLVIPSHDERSADERPPVVSVATQTRDGVPAARDARDAGAVPAPQAKLGERDDGVGMPPSASATTTASASAATASASAAAASASAAAVREAAARDNDPPSEPSARSANSAGRSASATATPSVPATAPAKPPSTTGRSWWWRWEREVVDGVEHQP